MSFFFVIKNIQDLRMKKQTENACVYTPTHGSTDLENI